MLINNGLTIAKEAKSKVRNNGSCTLSMLAAKTGLTRTAIQRDHELYLIRKGFISIDNIRYITTNGCKALETIKK